MGDFWYNEHQHSDYLYCDALMKNISRSLSAHHASITKDELQEFIDNALALITRLSGYHKP
jgi:hypothetical protein